MKTVELLGRHVPVRAARIAAAAAFVAMSSTAIAKIRHSFAQGEPDEVAEPGTGHGPGEAVIPHQ